MTYRRIFAIAAIGLLLVAPVLAQDATVVTAPPGTTVTIPVGNWLSEYVIPLVGTVLGALVMVALTFLIGFLPAWLRALITPALQKQIGTLAIEAINWGVQATSGAAHGKEISVPVGSQVVANAVQQALDTWPKHLIDSLGGVEGVKTTIITWLERAGVILPDDSTAAQVLAAQAVKSIKNPQ